MASLQNKMLRMLLILAVGVLPFATVDCDLEDGEFDIDIDDWDRNCGGYYCDDGYYYEEYYYDDYYYDPWDWWF